MALFFLISRVHYSEVLGHHASISKTKQNIITCDADLSLRAVTYMYNTCYSKERLKGSSYYV